MFLRLVNDVADKYTATAWLLPWVLKQSYLHVGKRGMSAHTPSVETTTYSMSAMKRNNFQ